METNILIALNNLVNNPVSNLASFSKSSNRVNSVGESLEQYIKDIFCNSIDIVDSNKKAEIYSKHFSYLGNQNNPPDIIIKNGDAIEVKKIQGINASIALNSSYPKDKLYSDSPMISADCRDCESWSQKDLLYTIGVTESNTLKSLWFVYGDCYAASREVYEKIKDKISKGLNELPDVELAETDELGRVNKVDPLGITNMRIRNMWQIINPNKVFNYIDIKLKGDFVVNALILKIKYNSFPEKDRKSLESIKIKGFSITNVMIKSPNNPAKLLDAILISFIK